jgi:hypothetical protein
MKTMLAILRSGIWAAACMLLAGVAAADELGGRLFTTPEQRMQLDELRYRKDLALEIAEFEQEPGPEVVEVEMIDPITVRGIVHRRGGNNTAWINDGATFRGDRQSHYFMVNPDDIDKDGYVRIRLPGEEDSLRLRVGESYEPATGKTHDVIGSD